MGVDKCAGAPGRWRQPITLTPEDDIAEFHVATSDKAPRSSQHGSKSGLALLPITNSTSQSICPSRPYLEKGNRGVGVGMCVWVCECIFFFCALANPRTRLANLNIDRLTEAFCLRSWRTEHHQMSTLCFNSRHPIPFPLSEKPCSALFCSRGPLPRMGDPAACHRHPYNNFSDLVQGRSIVLCSIGFESSRRILYRTDRRGKNTRRLEWNRVLPGSEIPSISRVFPSETTDRFPPDAAIARENCVLRARPIALSNVRNVKKKTPPW